MFYFLASLGLFIFLLAAGFIVGYAIHLERQFKKYEKQNRGK